MNSTNLQSILAKGTVTPAASSTPSQNASPQQSPALQTILAKGTVTPAPPKPKGTIIPGASVVPSIGQRVWSDIKTGAQDVAGTMKSLEQPFVSTAAIPVQALAKAMGKPDPYQKGIGGGPPPADVSPLSQPLKKVGEAGEVASYMIPYGRFEKLGTVGRLITGALSGYGIDVSSALAKGKKMEQAAIPGLATAIGTAIPAAGIATRVLARGVGETLGVTTGTGYGVIRQAFEAGTKGIGSPQEKEFISALKGNADPASIVEEARNGLSTIVTQRRQNYQNALASIDQSKGSLDVSPIITTLHDQLSKFGVAVKNGALDFSKSAIRFDKEAQSTISTIYDEMKTFGTQKGDRTAKGVDSLKQALSDLYSKSSNVRALVTAVTKSARHVLDGVPGYDAAMKDYANKTEIISNIQKALSLGSQAQVDTAYKKLASALRLNNEFRKEMISQLDQATGGALSSKIAGEQMSEWLPRGLMRPLEGAGAAGAVISGMVWPVIKFAFAASPKTVGILVNALGLTSEQANRLFTALGGMKTLQSAISPTIQAVNKQSSPSPSAQQPQSPSTTRGSILPMGAQTTP